MLMITIFQEPREKSTLPPSSTLGCSVDGLLYAVNSSLPRLGTCSPLLLVTVVYPGGREQ